MVAVLVLESINQDFVLKVERRPNPGETVTNAELSTHNGGKGANQVAADLLGAPPWPPCGSFEAAHSIQERAILIPL